MTWIDSHVHVWTQDTDRYPAPGFDVSTLEPKESTAEWLFRHCRPFDVSRIVLVQAIYGVDNSYMLDTAARYPGVFGIVASVDHNDQRVGGTMADLKERGVMGFRIVAQPGRGDSWLDHPGYKAMFEAARQTGQAICPLTHPDGVSDLDRMCSEHPDTTVVVDHMSRIGELNPIDDDEIDRLCALARHPNVNVKVSRLHALGAKSPPHDDLVPMIERVIDAFGPGRVMWGSDAPYQVVTESYSDSVRLVRDRLGLSESDRQSVMHDTAARLFFP